MWPLKLSSTNAESIRGDLQEGAPCGVVAASSTGTKRWSSWMRTTQGLEQEDCGITDLLDLMEH